MRALFVAVALTAFAAGAVLSAPTDDNPNYAQALQMSMFFYEAQRAGRKDPTNRVSWRGDSVLSDGSDVGIDLSGGWFDAGDHIKFAVPMAYSATMLAWGGLVFRDGYVRSGQMPYLKSNLRFVADYMLKAHSLGKFVFAAQVGDADKDHSSWVAPEMIIYADAAYRPTSLLTAQCPGSEATGGTSAALAAISLLLREDDPAYADLLLRHATELHEFADTYRGIYTDCVPRAKGYYDSYSGYQDELAWAGVWMYKATQNSAYLAKARDAYAQSTGGAGCGCAWTLSWDDVSYGAAILLYEVTGDAMYATNIERNINHWRNNLPKTAGGLSFLNQWGSLRYATTTAFTALAYARLIKAQKPSLASTYETWAKSQVDYALGKNPAGRSYLIGYGANFPRNPHHRGASGPWGNNVACCPYNNRHVLIGALVGGPKSADDFAYQDIRGDWVANEVATDYNAGISGALAALAETYPGTPLAVFPPQESYTPADEFGASIGINTEDAQQFTEYRIKVRQTTAWPARRVQLAVRYYMDLSDVASMGLAANPIDAVSVVLNYADGGNSATLSTGKVLGGAPNVYYFEVAWPANKAPWPGGDGNRGSEYEAQVRISLKNSARNALWNRRRDYSASGGMGTGSAPVATTRLPLYSEGIRVFGSEPSAGSASAVLPTETSAAKTSTAIPQVTSSSARPATPMTGAPAATTNTPAATVTSKPATTTTSTAPVARAEARCLWEDNGASQAIIVTARVDNTGSSGLALASTTVQYYFGGDAPSTSYAARVLAVTVVDPFGTDAPVVLASADASAAVSPFGSGSSRHVAQASFKAPTVLAARRRLILTLEVYPLVASVTFSRNSEYSRVPTATDSYASCPGVVVRSGSDVAWGSVPAVAPTQTSTAPAKTSQGPTSAPAKTTQAPTVTGAPSALTVGFEPGSSGDNSIAFRVSITNTGAAVPLSSLSVQFYFDGKATGTVAAGDYATDVYSSAITTSGPPYYQDILASTSAAVSVVPSGARGARLVSTAAFASGSLATGSTLTVQFGIHANDWSSLNRAADYSWQGTSGRNDRVVVAVGGVVVSGVPPS